METAGRSEANEVLILDMLDRFLKTEVKPYVHALEAADEYPHEIVEKMKEHGSVRLPDRAEYGGLGLSHATYARIVDRISAVWMSVTGIINSHLMMAMTVQRNGTDEQKRDYLPRFATGEMRGGLGADRAGCRHRPAGDPHRRRGATATTTSSTAPRPGSPTASRATCSRCWSRPIPNAEPRHAA